MLIFIVIFIACCVGMWFFLNSGRRLALPISQKIGTLIANVKTPTNNILLDHVVIILMENKSNKAIVGSQEAPYINSLLQKYSFASNYFAVAHPSLPNYIALIGGSTFNITSDCTDCYISSTNLIDQLDHYHKTWKAYMESMPTSCFLGNADKYAQKHNPFVYFDNIRNNQKRCQNIVPFTVLQLDFQSATTTPDFVWVSPNLCDDMHDCSIAQGDKWLSDEVPRILSSTAFKKQHSLLVITWDEGEGVGGNQVPAIFIGDMVKQGFVSHAYYTHYSLLHAIENLWQMPSLTANVAKSNIVTDIFKNQ